MGHISSQIFSRLSRFKDLTAVFMSSSLVWRITPCSPLNPLATCFQAVILLSLFDPEDGGYGFPKRRLNFNGLHPDHNEEIQMLTKTKLKLHGLSPRANYTDRATAACRRSDCQHVRTEGATWSA
jgi:hypothetical protein